MVKRVAEQGRPVLLALLVCVLFLLAGAGPASRVARAAAGGHWQQTAVDLNAKKSDDTSTYSVSDGSSTLKIVVPDVGDRFASTATWTSPKASYAPGETAELSLHVTVDEYVWNGEDTGYIHQGLNHAGDSVLARIDAAGQSYNGVTGGAVYLQDESGNHLFSVAVDTGTQVTSSAGGTVRAQFPVGYQSGELLALYVVTNSGAARYTYAWMAEGEAAPTSTQSTTATTTQSTAPKTTPPGSSRFTIVISPALYLGGEAFDPGFAKGTRFEIIDGQLDTVVTYNNCQGVRVKGSFDPATGKLTATMSIPPQNVGGKLWTAFEGTIVLDLAKEGTAGFMTISGPMWQWIEDDGLWQEGDDKGPPGDFPHRVHYTVEGPTPDYPAKVHKGDVDSNLRFVGDPPKGVRILRAASGEMDTLEDDPVIYVGDTIVVPPGQRAQFYQGSGGPGEGGYWENSINIDGGSYLTITDQATLLGYGEFLYNHVRQLDRNPKFEDFQLQLAHLKARLKGTTIVWKEDGQSSTIKVLEGGAICTGLDGSQTMDLAAGQTLTATVAGLGDIGTFDVAAEQMRWDAFSAGPALELDQGGFPLWLLILIVVVVAAFLAAAVLFFIWRRRKSRRLSTGGARAAGLHRLRRQAAPAAVVAPRQIPCPACGSAVQEGVGRCLRCGAAAPTPAPDWYCTKHGSQAGQTIGPLTWRQLSSAVQDGTVGPGDLVWNPTLPQWLTAAQIGELFSPTAVPGS
jgi:hypothetical protein